MIPKFSLFQHAFFYAVVFHFHFSWDSHSGPSWTSLLIIIFCAIFVNQKQTKLPDPRQRVRELGREEITLQRDAAGTRTGTAFHHPGRG